MKSMVANTPISASDGFASVPRTTFLILVAAMTLLYVVSWPAEYSLDLWVFKDRGSYLKLDEMLDLNLRLGIDTFYSYGLIPVLVQHWLFAIFGRGPWPLIGTHVFYILLTAGAWTMIVERLPDPRSWRFIILALIPILVWVNPNLPYVFVQLSLLFSIALLLQGRYSAALAVSAIGCWSVPTVTLLASALILGMIVLDWLSQRGRSVGGLVRVLAPGAIAYFGLGLFLSLFFGIRSVISTALPLQGMAEYKKVHYGMFTTLREFLHPSNALHGSWLRYYAFDRATWWVLSSLLLFALGSYAIVQMLKARRLTPGYMTVVLCATIEGAFTFFAYGSVTQHVIFDPIIVAGVVIGLGLWAASPLRTVLVSAFVVVGVLGQINQAAYTYSLWRDTRRSAEAANFYAPAEFTRHWTQIVDLSKSHRTFMLSYGTGIQHYYPSIDVPDLWTFQLGELLPQDRERMLVKLRAAEVLAEDRSGPTDLFETDPDILNELSHFCLIEKNSAFIVWSRESVGLHGATCQDPTG